MCHDRFQLKSIDNFEKLKKKLLNSLRIKFDEKTILFTRFLLHKKMLDSIYQIAIPQITINTQSQAKIRVSSKVPQNVKAT